MKSILFSVAAVVAVFTAQAEWLSWCVSVTDEFGDVNESEVAYMRVGYVTQGSQPYWSGTILTAYTSDGDESVAGGAGSSKTAGRVTYTGNDGRFKVDVSGLSAGNYGFYIELLNSSGEIIGRTGRESDFTYATYESLKPYISTGEIGDVPSVSVWHGDGFQAVPEPSSMALLALGAGLVGLRRKLRKNKKAKKEKRA